MEAKIKKIIKFIKKEGSGRFKVIFGKEIIKMLEEIINE